MTIDTSVTEEIKEELIAREITRLIQAIRKEMSLTKLEKVDVEIAADEAIRGSIEKNIEKIKEITNSRKVLFQSSISDSANAKELEVEGGIIKIALKKLQQ